MKIGDRARDRASGFTGTVVGMDTASDTTLRVCLEADPSEADEKPENFGKPPRLWTAVANAELIDADGKVVVGKSSKEIDTEGRQIGETDKQLGRGRERDREDADADKRQHDAAEQRIADQRKALEAKTPAPGARPA